jgi:hypothetical protein
MLTSILPELQRHHGNMDAHIIIIHLKELFDIISVTERYKTSKELFHWKMTKSSFMNTYI